MITRLILAAAVIAGALALAGGQAYAHAFGERYDLPIPLSYFMAGAAATVALSFVVIGMFLRGGSAEYRYPRLNLLALPGASAAFRILAAIARILSVLLLILVIAAALFGSDNPLANFSPTFVWIIWWVGMGYVSALLGNLWMLINPWKALYEFAEWLLRRIGVGMPAPREYPKGWDMMPALLAFLAFVWLENVYPAAIVPNHLAAIVIVYSLYTLGGMLLFGKHAWLRYCDPFTALFSIFARFSPTEVRVVGNACGDRHGSGRGDRHGGRHASEQGDRYGRCELDCAAYSADGNAGDCVDCYACFERADWRHRQFNLRPWAAGLVPEGNVAGGAVGSVAGSASGSAMSGGTAGNVNGGTAVSWQACMFVVLALAAVTFDGLQETTNWLAVQTIGLRLLGPGGVSVVDTLGVALIPLLFLAIYLLFCVGVRALSGNRASVPEVARAYVFSLVPIALAYNMAHFLSLLLVQGQLIIPLASDPFGFGWNIFGAAGYRIDPTIVSSQFAWVVSVAAIVVGHIVSVYLAHTIAVRRAPSHRLALRGQYPMLALMVFYTAVSLWIIAQPIVAK